MKINNKARRIIYLLLMSLTLSGSILASDSITEINNEQIVWYRAIVAGLIAVVTGLVVRLWSHGEKDSEENKGNIKKHIADSENRFSSLEIKVALLENRKYVTLEDLNMVVDKALDRVAHDYGQQHSTIMETNSRTIEEFSKRLEKINEDSAERVEACNRAIRTELGSRMDEMSGMVKELTGVMIRSGMARNKKR